MQKDESGNQSPYEPPSNNQTVSSSLESPSDEVWPWMKCVIAMFAAYFFPYFAIPVASVLLGRPGITVSVRYFICSLLSAGFVSLMFGLAGPHRKDRLLVGFVLAVLAFGGSIVAPMMLLPANVLAGMTIKLGFLVVRAAGITLATMSILWVRRMPFVPRRILGSTLVLTGVILLISMPRRDFGLIGLFATMSLLIAVQTIYLGRKPSS